MIASVRRNSREDIVVMLRDDGRADIRCHHRRPDGKLLSTTKGFALHGVQTVREMRVALEMLERAVAEAKS
ncbi:MAG: hypothetical protein JWM36_698 [Hyphomicrobiales bacterium]|nr:hypothetical protein [Hyphomicrobiales bacterium]